MSIFQLMCRFGWRRTVRAPIIQEYLDSLTLRHNGNLVELLANYAVVGSTRCALMSMPTTIRTIT